ncbi:MAG: hypothetical protein KGL50_06055 [Burkholderiales bacterium]|nr:hypothetical protein [Burkholderiales bacterium]
MESSQDSTAATPKLRGLAQKQSNALYDVQALIAAVVDRIDDIRSPLADDALHSTYRLAQMAQRRVNAVIDALEPLTL